ncbi:ABC transporter permease DevC [Gloeothece verrucosa]|uniref:DevC protein n=1 Tax=Gloeothece verrucosa (strain PCC 7822) TaxID=497965 RepID=E0UL89_GLOV7|nr:ABC transporter permease DevC [Gloeothece verrucosa]ADN17719.1 DevC protein [Gloeothece verrucosa PCC 7822]
MFFDIPLAWRQLIREKSRMMVVLTGITFADILMFMQLGFQSALYDSAARIHHSVNADLVMISSRSKSLSYMRAFPRRRLYQALSFDGVQSVTPIYVGYRDWKNPKTSDFRTIFIYGFEPVKPFADVPGLAENIDKIRIKDKILFDQASRLEYGDIVNQFQTNQIVTTELGNKKIDVVGLFTLGPTFSADGNIITSDSTFLHLFPDRQAEQINIGLIQIKPNADIKQVAENLKQQLPNDIIIYNKQEFVEFEKRYWQTSTAIGFIFALSMSMGFIVGTVIVYQILYTDVSEHLSEYATLIAMGYKYSYLLIVIFQESIILSVLGYMPSLLIAINLYSLTKSATFLPMLMTSDKIILVFILTVIMCSISGLLAMRKLLQADPADIF